MILAIDPGPKESAWVTCDPSRMISNRILTYAICANTKLLWWVTTWYPDNGAGSLVAIEGMACYGMPVGREVFETCMWIGRFWQAALPAQVVVIPRPKIKAHLCGTPRAKDANVRQALIDKYGPPGRKYEPGPTYGLRSHMWSALAVADYAAAEMENAP